MLRAIRRSGQRKPQLKIHPRLQKPIGLTHRVMVARTINTSTRELRRRSSSGDAEDLLRTSLPTLCPGSVVSLESSLICLLVTSDVWTALGPSLGIMMVRVMYNRRPVPETKQRKTKARTLAHRCPYICSVSGPDLVF